MAPRSDSEESGSEFEEEVSDFLADELDFILRLLTSCKSDEKDFNCRLHLSQSEPAGGCSCTHFLSNAAYCMMMYDDVL